MTLDVYPYYPEDTGDDPTHPAYARYAWDARWYKELGFKTILSYLAAINSIASRESWRRVLTR